MAKEAKKAGAKIASITHFKKSPLTTYSDAFYCAAQRVSVGRRFHVGEDGAAISDRSSVSGILLKELRSMPGKQPEDIDSSGRKVILGGNYVTEDI